MVLHIFLDIKLYSLWSTTDRKRRSLPAVYGDGPVLSKLFLGLVHLPDEVDETLAHLRNALLRPVRELKLANRSRLAVLITATIRGFFLSLS